MRELPDKLCKNSEKYSKRDSATITDKHIVVLQAQILVDFFIFSSIIQIIWKNRSFRNRENLHNLEAADYFIQTVHESNGKCNNLVSLSLFMSS